MGSQPRVAATPGGDRKKQYDPAVIYDPLSKPRRRPWRSPEKPTPASVLPSRFPDEDHAYQPLRRVQVAKLQQNTLPPPTPSPREVPTCKHHRLANLTDSAMWGFPVRYSPSQELGDQWKNAKVVESTEDVVKARQAKEEAAAEREKQQAQRRAELSRQDYALYLYLASRFGALDAILYCCTPYPGRLYALLIDQSVRKIQKWRQERLLALRTYWIVTLARGIVATSFQSGSELVLRAKEHQRRAGVFLKRLRWRFAASAFRSWFEYTQKQIEVRWRFQFAMQEDLRARFERWRQRVADVKAFKKQLKQVARRKQIQGALVQWQEWKQRQHKLRTHLQSQWTKLQSNCMEQWRVYTTRAKIQRLAAIRLQAEWRMYWSRRQFTRIQRSVAKITKVARGFLARRLVVSRRQSLEMVQAIEQLIRVLEWDDLGDRCRIARAAAVAREVERIQEEAQFIAQAEQGAVAFVTSELDKVRKNDMHHRLQQKIVELQEQGGDRTESTRGRQTQEALAQQAVELLIQEAKAVARVDEQSKFLHEIQASDQANHPPICQRNVCCVCTATVNEVQQDSVPWATAYVTQNQGVCPHYSLLSGFTTTPEHLVHALSDILTELQAHDAHVRAQLLQDAIPVPLLWARLGQNGQYLLAASPPSATLNGVTTSVSRCTSTRPT